MKYINISNPYIRTKPLTLFILQYLRKYLYDLYVYRHEKFWAQRNSFASFLLVNVNKQKYIVCVACGKKYDLNSKFQKVGSNVGHYIFDFCVFNIIHEVIFVLFTFLQEFCPHWIDLAILRNIFEIWFYLFPYCSFPTYF